jgi:hypothetical protein
VVELGHQRGERTPWTKTVGTCHRFPHLPQPPAHGPYQPAATGAGSPKR